MYPVVRTIVPALLTGRASMKTPLEVTVVPLGMESAPLPPMTPLLHVMEAPVRLIGAVPCIVPACMLSVGTLSAEAPLSVSVPPLAVMAPVLVGAAIVVVALLIVWPGAL